MTNDPILFCNVNMVSSDGKRTAAIYVVCRVAPDRKTVILRKIEANGELGPRFRCPRANVLRCGWND